MSEEQSEKHPSYGMIRFTRKTGNPGRLFGSSLPKHESFITLGIGPGERTHTGAQDRYYGSMRGELIEVDMSASQFTELLTTMNIGSGVPCTIRYVNGKKVENPPETKLEVEKIRTGFAREMKSLASEIHERAGKIDTLLQKKTLSYADKKEIQNHFQMVAQHVESNIPYTLSQFEEASERVVQAAKSEIDAFMMHNIIAAGLAFLAQKPENTNPQLTSENISDNGEP